MSPSGHLLLRFFIVFFLLKGEPGSVGPKGNAGEPGLQVPLMHFFENIIYTMKTP